MMVTRRWFYLIPAQGEPVKLVHKIEAGHLDSLPGEKNLYAGWQELFDQVKAIEFPVISPRALPLSISRRGADSSC